MSTQDNLDELIDEVEKKLGQGQEEDVSPEKSETPETLTQDVKPEETPGETPSDSKSVEDEQAVIKSPKGAEIPYAVLKAERGARRAAEQRAAELQARVQAMESSGVAGAAGQDVDGLSAEELAELDLDLPHLGKAIRSLQSKIGTLEAQRRAAEELARQQAQDELNDSVADAIRGNATLSHLSSTLKPEVWNKRVVELDEQMRADPEFSRLSLPERFDKLVEIYAYRHGPVKLPDQAPATTTTTIETKKAAAEALKGAKQSPWNTLSDLPGGSPPGVSEHDVLLNLSQEQLTARLERMSSAQIDKLLNQLA